MVAALAPLILKHLRALFLLQGVLGAMVGAAARAGEAAQVGAVHLALRELRAEQAEQAGREVLSALVVPEAASF